MRPFHQRGWRSGLGLAIPLLLAGPAFAQSHLGPDDHCTLGHATAVAQNYYVLGFNESWRSAPFGDAGETTALCEFRSFFAPLEELCFCEHDAVFGGDTWSQATSDASELRAARQFLRRLEADFRWSGPAGAEARFVTTAVAGLRSAGRDEDGPIRWARRQFGLIFSHLVPGFYEVAEEVSHPELGLLWSARNRFRALSHDVAHDLGRPPNELAGSVTCPLERDCANDLDDDGDGGIDCADVNCRVPWWGETDGLNLSCFAGSFIELGEALGSPVWTGSTDGKANDWLLPCGFWPGSAGDDEFRWTAPTDGTYTIDTIGSALGTVLGVSTGRQNLCNEDISDTVWQSAVTVSLRAGDQVVIIVDGFADDEGSYVLNISASPAPLTSNRHPE